MPIYTDANQMAGEFYVPGVARLAQVWENRPEPTLVFDKGGAVLAAIVDGTSYSLYTFSESGGALANIGTDTVSGRLAPSLFQYNDGLYLQVGNLNPRNNVLGYRYVVDQRTGSLSGVTRVQHLDSATFDTEVINLPDGTLGWLYYQRIDSRRDHVSLRPYNFSSGLPQGTQIFQRANTRRTKATATNFSGTYYVGLFAGPSDVVFYRHSTGDQLALIANVTLPTSGVVDIHLLAGRRDLLLLTLDSSANRCYTYRVNVSNGSLTLIGSTPITLSSNANISASRLA